MSRYLRFAGPIAVLALVAMSPVWLTALRAKPPIDLAQASSADRLAGGMVAITLAVQLALAGAVAATVDARNQVHALWRGLVGFARAIVPIALALLAVVIGSLALAIPGLLLLALFSLAGPAAQTEGGSSHVLARSATAARAQPLLVIAVVLGMLAIDIGGVAIAHLAFAGLPAKPKPPDLARVVTYVYVVAGLLVAAAPVAAVALATVYSRATSASRSPAASSTVDTRASV